MHAMKGSCRQNISYFPPSLTYNPSCDITMGVRDTAVYGAYR